MIILQNCLLAIVGAGGVVWYKSSLTEVWPLLGYFLTLCSVGSVSAIACYIRDRPFLLIANGVNGVAIGLLLALQVSAFMISPGSGIAAFPFVAVPLAIIVNSLRWIRTEVKGYSSDH